MAIVINGSGTLTGVNATGISSAPTNATDTTKLPLAGGTMTGTIAGFTSTGIDDNADATAITINSSEKIGIGTSSPQNFLHIQSGDSANDNYRTGADTPLIVEGTTASYIQFVADTNAPMGILMGDTSDTATGGVIYDANGGGLTLKSGGSTRLYAATNGKIGINGEDSPDAALHIGGSSGWIDIGAGNRTKVGFDSNHMYMGSSASAGNVIFKSGITSNGNPADSGTEIARIQSTGGISFNGDSAAANALDDYEEGNCTIRFKAEGHSTQAGSSVAKYIKIGKKVTVRVDMSGSISGLNQSSNMELTGLPFITNGVFTFPFFTRNLEAPSDTTNIVGYLPDNAYVAQIWFMPNHADYVQADVQDFHQSTNDCYWTVTYFTD